MLTLSPLLGLAAGLAAALLQFAGALKSSPALAWLPVDLTALAAAATLALLAPLLAQGGWRVSRGLGAPLLAAAGMWLWWCVAALWSGAGDAALAKAAAMVLLGPLMLLAGMLVGADHAARQAMAGTVVAIGVLVGVSVAWGIASGGVVLGGEVGADPTRVRVQYQLVGLAIATAAAVVAGWLVEARPPMVPVLFALLVALAVASVLPGGRAALLALGVAAMVAPALRLWLAGRQVAALAWVLGILGAGAVALAALVGDSGVAVGLRTLERILGQAGDGPEERLYLWSEALRLGGLAGIGPGGFPVAAGFGDDRGMHPHNHALESLAEAGLPGLALWVCAFGGALALVLARAHRLAPGRAAVILAMVLPMAVTVMVSTDLTNRMAWFALGLALSVGLERVRV